MIYPEQGAPGALVFPREFLWGAATASYQIEGAVSEDGRTPSIWDTFARVPGAVAGGDTGDVACDHYHRYEEDVDLMARLGLDAYRFSLSWPRILPAAGRVNPLGLDFYERLVDCLAARGIEPWITLYHWDLPQWLEDRGGWAARESADHFAELTEAVHGRLGDRVKHWITLNEPWCSSNLGYIGGGHAPGRQDDQAGVDATHHLMLAHGHALRVLRADPSAVVGYTINTTVPDPLDPANPADVAAAAQVDALWNRVYLEPLFLGRYPEEAVTAFASAGCTLPIRDGDLELISAPIDFLGLNYYHGHAVSATPPPPERRLRHLELPRPTRNPYVGIGEAHTWSRGLPRTPMDWEVQPEGLTRLLTRMQRDYTGPAGIPLYVTENGAVFEDTFGPDGVVEDPDRAAFIRDHVAAVHAALEAGVDVRGYFAWSLLDNFEWAYGYAQRFGIVHVDFETQVRTLKRSALEYARIIATSSVTTPGHDSVRT